MEPKTKIELLHGAYITQILNTIGVRIYPVVAPENAGSDYVIYRRDSLENINIKGRPSKYATEAYYTIAVVNDTYSDGVDMTVKILDTITDYHNDNVADIQIMDVAESYQDNAYIQQIKIKIITK